MIRNLLLAGFASMALALTAQADSVGQKFPAVELEGLAQSPAETFEDFSGRLVLVEFFAYW